MVMSHGPRDASDLPVCPHPVKGARERSGHSILIRAGIGWDKILALATLYLLTGYHSRLHALHALDVRVITGKNAYW